MIKTNKILTVSIAQQIMECFENDNRYAAYKISTGKKGFGEEKGSERTPRGWHRVYSIIGLEYPVNSVLVGRVWTGELYTEQLAAQFTDRDWILTRIIQLDGLEPGRNKGGNVDTLERYIYIHGTPDTTPLGIPGSRGCIRMSNPDVIKLASWVDTETLVYIQQ